MKSKAFNHSKSGLNHFVLSLSGTIRLSLVFSAFLASASMAFAQDSSTVYLKSGQQKFNSKLYNAASKDFEKAIQFNPSNADAYIENGKVNLAMNRIYEAGESFNKAHELQPGNKEITKELMLIQYNSRKNEKAIELAGQCDCEEADRIIGMSYYRMEDYGKAMTYLQKALKKNENDGDAAYTLGRTFLELEKDKDAIAYFEKAVKAKPANSNWHYELGLLYYNMGNYTGAAGALKDAAAAGYRQSNDFMENLGFCQLYSGDIDNGLQNLNTVLQRKPDNTTILTNIAYAMYSTKRYQGAVDYYEKVLTINPKDATALYMAGMAFQKMGQKEKGQAICDKAIEMDPSLAKNRQKKEMPMGL